MQIKTERRQARSDARRRLVLDAAGAVFAQAGLEGASIREIAKRAGYTPGAIYSYFENKEAIYAALLDESLGRLQTAVAEARSHKSQPGKTLAAKAQAWFDFYAQHPRELELGFYLTRGLHPHGLTTELNRALNDRLYAALRPCEDALRAMGLAPAHALQENTALFAHGVGLLLLQHTGRIRMFRQSADALFGTYVDELVARYASTGEPAPGIAGGGGQAELFTAA